MTTARQKQDEQPKRREQYEPAYLWAPSPCEPMPPPISGADDPEDCRVIIIEI